MDGNLVGAEDAGFIGRVGGFQRDGIVLAPQPLEGDLRVIDQGNHDCPVIGIVGVLGFLLVGGADVGGM